MISFVYGILFGSESLYVSSETLLDVVNLVDKIDVNNFSSDEVVSR